RKRSSSRGNSPSSSADNCSWVASFMTCYLDIGEQRTEFLVDCVSRAENARAHGAYRTLHGFSDFFVTQSIDLAQRNRGFQFFGQLFDSLEHGSFNFLAQKFVLRGGPVLEACPAVQLHRIIDADIVLRRPAPLGNQVILGGVDGDLVHPRIELAVATEST